ncbi:MAG TPA: VWA domain-containing protein [Terriglobia bacterium]|nr:VWA domain-containing protein [Terriglobia bacterium]
MGTRWSYALALAVLGALQQPQPSANQFRIRVSVNLVQVDATVTDSHGKPVPGLTSDDFQILLDGKPQKISSCSFIETGGRASARPAPAQRQPSVPEKLEGALPPMPAAPLKRQEVRRTVVLFVDDLSMSAESVPAVRRGLRNFIDRQLQPGDLVAIVRASAGLGALQDFTTDRNLLLAAVDQVRWTPLGRGGAQAYTPIGMDPAADKLLTTNSLGSQETTHLIETATVATAASLWRLVHGMADLPGRKAVVVLSDSLPLAAPDEKDSFQTVIVGSGMGGRILASMRRVVDESVRAGVVIYAIDTRGLNSLTAQASDRPRPPDENTEPGAAGKATAHLETPPLPNPDPNGDWVWTVMQRRRDEYREGQWGAMFLASETGGFMVTEANFIDAGIERIMSEQSGYYLLGFTPSAEALAPDRYGHPVYRRLKIEVRRPGLHVRSHQDFFGVADEDMAPASSPALQLAAALESPFQSSGVRMEIQSGFLSARKDDALIRTAVVLDGRDLDLTGPAIHRTGVIHLIVRAFDASGNQVEGGIDEALRIDLNEEGYERALKYGLIYTTLLPVSKPGPYQVRAACRDENTGKVGTAGEFVLVPKLQGLALSGIFFQRSQAVDNDVRPATGSMDYAPGERAQFTLQIINAPATPLTMRTRLFRDGAEVYESPATPVEMGTPRAGRAFTRGAIEIPANLEPGDYLMRVEVEDQLPPPRHAKAWQWVRLGVAAGRISSGEFVPHNERRSELRFGFDVSRIIQLGPTGVSDVVEVVAHRHAVGWVAGSRRTPLNDFGGDDVRKRRGI